MSVFNVVDATRDDLWPFRKFSRNTTSLSLGQDGDDGRIPTLNFLFAFFAIFYDPHATQWAKNEPGYYYRVHRSRRKRKAIRFFPTRTRPTTDANEEPEFTKGVGCGIVSYFQEDQQHHLHY